MSVLTAKLAKRGTRIQEGLPRLAHHLQVAPRLQATPKSHQNLSEKVRRPRKS